MDEIILIIPISFHKSYMHTKKGKNVCSRTRSFLSCEIFKY